MLASRKKNKIGNKLNLSKFVFCLTVIFFILNCQKVSATDFNFKEGDIDKSLSEKGCNSMSSFVEGSSGGKLIAVYDSGVCKVTQKGMLKRALDQIKTWVIKNKDEYLKKAASKAFGAALTSALNTIAYDTATWLGSGAEGQKPMWMREPFGEFLDNTLSQAQGAFIESLSKDWKFNLCEPDIDLKGQIALGLKQYAKPSAPKCTFKKMLDNWETELESKDFLKDLQDMFDPASNDLGIALSLESMFHVQTEKETEAAAKARQESGGWINSVNPISNWMNTTPREAEKRLESARATGNFNLAKYTGDALVDASNIFLNQLAITAFNKLLNKLGEEGESSTPPYEGDYGLSDYESSGSSGAAGAEEMARELLEPKFNVRGDYEILTELTSCPDQDKVGPTNCVITDKFSQAVSLRKNVGEAMDEGYLNSEGTFGFTSGDNLEPDYADENYPYRSMIILRKFRIIPVGWEVAAEYIKDHSADLTTITLSDMVECFDYEDEKYEGYEPADGWCKGLVDPTWVLKAPLNYCAKEGPGPEITSEQTTGEGEDSELFILRNDTYCADERACINENSDGSCVAYGYCTEERRKWNFGSDSCEPVYNTCQTFKPREGDTASYLENTLNYNGCNAENVGCKKYAYAASNDNTYAEDNTKVYNTASSTVNWEKTSGSIYLNKNAEDCGEEDEGCHGFIRTKPDLGANLLTNASFEDDIESDSVWYEKGSRTEGDGYDGSYGFTISKNLDGDTQVASSTYSIAGEEFTFSLYAKNCGTSGAIGIEDKTVSLSTSDSWSRFEVTYLYATDSGAGNQVNIKIKDFSASGCVIDAVKLERADSASTWSDYGDKATVYEKLMPNYLESACKQTDAPEECDNFAAKCSEDEVGCEMYTSTTLSTGTSAADDSEIPARVANQDYCPSECEGYDTFVQMATSFDSSRDAYFIPKTAKTCSADAAGCDEFTNLDKEESGGEAREYYSYLRQCVKSSDSNCAEFYTWEGSDETGYQLKTMSLKKDSSSSDNPPALTKDDSSECSQTIYNLDPSDASYNADCREFYNTDGQTSYHLYSRTISCSDDCHPYRRTLVNIDPDITGSSDCSGSDKHWDSTEGQCVVCESGGKWDDQHQACLYDAVPSENISCSSAYAGCREYSGNTGNNVEVVLSDDFEGSTEGWTGLDGSSADLSSDALTAGGNSLYVSSSPYKASTTVGTNVEQGKSYVLSFLAKGASTGASLSEIKLTNGSSDAKFSTVSLTSEWQIYEVNLSELDHSVGSSESLVIVGSASFYFDNVKLTEITDRYYLIRDSWDTPESCDEDAEGNPHSLYMLGCEKYSDRDNLTHYLHSFNQLCADSAVGCELLIDTKNSTAYGAAVYNDDDEDGACESGEESCFEVPADEYVYAVYDRDKECNSADKGCERLGESYEYGSEKSYEDVYLKNNPDDYGEILCSENEVGCEEWTATENGQSVTSYFKDPGDEVCEYRQAEGSESYGWYKRKMKRCDTDSDGGGDSNICQSDKDCSDDEDCKTESADNACNTDTDEPKTFGYGGSGNAIDQPSDWAGACAASASSCGELIDPISKFSSNLVYNGDFSQDVDSDGTPDGWATSTYSNYGILIQSVSLESNTLYVMALSGAGNGNDFVISSQDGSSLFYELNTDNELSATSSFIAIYSAAAARESKRFYTAGIEANIAVKDFTNDWGEVELKKAVIDYQLSDDLDKSSCNSVVNFEKGCVLFNERARNGSSYDSLVYDADATYDDGEGASPSSITDDNDEGGDSNALLKVTPDRVCDKWLACRSMAAAENDDGEEENVCYDISLCNGLDDSGNCGSFVSAVSSINQTYSSQVTLAEISNMSGYAKVGYDNGSLAADFYPLAAMEQEGEVVDASNGSFEYYGDNYYPLGWSVATSSDGNLSWSESRFKVIADPVTAEDEGVDYPIDGTGFLKFSPSSAVAESEFIDVEPKGEYVLSAYMNTLNFHPGTGFDAIAAGLDVTTYDSNGQCAGSCADFEFCSVSDDPTHNGCTSYLSQGLDWTKIVFKFRVGASVSKIKIKTQGAFWFGNDTYKNLLDNYDSATGSWCCDINGSGCSSSSSSNWYYHPSGLCVQPAGEYTTNICGVDYKTDVNADTCSGNVYVDDIKLKPALASRDSWYTTQTCRLYPETDSLSCGYYNDSGIWKKGWPGYCLEYDRSPGSSDACLLWWPIDRVKGDGVEEGTGYADRFPLYYCAEGQTDIVYEYRHAFFTFKGCTDNVDCREASASGRGCPSGYKIVKTWCYEKSGCEQGSCICVPEGDAIKLDGSSDNFEGVTGGCDDTTKGTEIRDPISENDGWYNYDGDLASLAYNDSVRITNAHPYSSEGQLKYNCSDNNDSTTCTASNPLCSGGNYNSDNNQGIVGCAASDCYCSLTKELYRTESYCLDVVQVVTPMGKNKYWAGRVYEGSAYTDPEIGIGYDQYLSPFGAINPPSPSSNPYEWDSIEDDSGDQATIGNQPLYEKTEEEGEASAGYIYGCTGAGGNSSYCDYVVDEDGPAAIPYSYRQEMSSSNTYTSKEIIKRLFAQSYGDWTWNGSNYMQGGSTWGPPDTLCKDSRPEYASGSNADYCAILPTVYNIKVDDMETGNATIIKSGFANLTFNSTVDSQQLPLVMLSIDWGDDEKMIISGVEMRDRTNSDDPHSFYHLYDYWDLKGKESGGSSQITCATDSAGNYCQATPKIKIKDNWGWCNEGYDEISGNYEQPTVISDCDQWQSGPSVKVWEKVTSDV